ncbi:hypothetical protein M404DRAFT_848632 [Pisolithus tinctorius Marx 270]|uniref:Uncharacterized protein n=1 Tax=Pisolithus tinctorius Marx 270 TaxID=870435 RepID=A0A0C3NTI8_PISTI|nr:hypothetical protein M404DRAFT_848632 [Pisolithus tinctorius Marx 270]
MCAPFIEDHTLGQNSVDHISSFRSVQIGPRSRVFLAKTRGQLESSNQSVNARRLARIEHVHELEAACAVRVAADHREVHLWT